MKKTIEVKFTLEIEYEPEIYRPAKIGVAPEDCYPDESEPLDVISHELTFALRTPKDIQSIFEDAIDYMMEEQKFDSLLSSNE